MLSFFKKKIKFNTSAPKEEVVAVELLGDKLYVAQLTGSIGNWQISKFDYTILDSLPNLDDEATRRSLSRTLENLLIKSKITTKNVAISVPTKNAIIRTVQAPLMTDEELEEAIKTNSLWENILNLGSINFDEYIIYHQVVRKITNQNLMEILFVGSPQKDIDKYIDILENAELSPVVVDVRCFALKSAADINKSKRDLNKVDAILNISSDENYLMIIRDNSQFITEIFTSPKDISELKKNENSPESKFEFLERYFLQVQEAINQFNSNSKKDGEKLVEKLEIVSPLNSVSNIISIATKILPNVEVKVLSALHKMIIPDQFKEKISSLNNTSVSSGVLGLATRKLDVFGYYKFVAAVKNINLLPNREKVIEKKKAQFKAKKFILFVTLFTIIISIFFIRFINNTLQENKTIKFSYNEIKSKHEKALFELKKLIKEKRTIETSTGSMNNNSSNQIATLKILNAIKYSINKNVAIENISIKEGKNVVIEGQSNSDIMIIKFIDKLKEYKIISGLELNYVQENENGLKEYKMQFFIKNIETEKDGNK